MDLKVTIDTSGLAGWTGRLEKRTSVAIDRAGADALRGMKAEGNRQVRARKAIKLAHVSDMLVTFSSPAKGGWASRTWTILAKTQATPLLAYNARQTAKGVRVEINRGTPWVIPGAFIATMKSGHVGVFMRHGQARMMPVQGYRGHKRYAGQRRQAIRELFTTRVSEAFGDASEAIAAKGIERFTSTFNRNMRAR